MKEVLIRLYEHKKDTKELNEFLCACIGLRILIIGGKNFGEKVTKATEEMHKKAKILGLDEDQRIKICKSLLKFNKHELVCFMECIKGQ